MNRIEKQVDRIIAGLKVNEALKNVRFIREYGSDEAPSPVNGMIAVVSVRDMSTEKSYIGGYLSPSIKGESYNAGVEIRVYAPATENGSGLSEVVSEILLGLKTADAEKTITHSEAGLEGLARVKIMRNLPKTALLHLQKYRISVIMSIV